MKTNYQTVLDNELKLIGDTKPKLLLHSCCGPCSTYVLEYLSLYFDITVFYYNPNIYPQEEFLKRSEEQQKLLNTMFENDKVKFAQIGYRSEDFYNAIKGYEALGEGSERCFRCYRLRLQKTAEYAKPRHFDYFTTTLSISPHKNAQELNRIGAEIAEEYGIKYLFSDFKKRGGYKRSCELSEMFGIYRQNYCGCIFSKQERGL